jgi:hypothetical protein
MKPRISFREAISDPQLLGHCLQGPSWRPWRVFLTAAFGEPLIDPEELDLFAQLSGGRVPALQRAEEIEMVGGRRGGKSEASSCAASYIMTCMDFSDVLSRGESGVCLIISPDLRQSSIIFNYTLAAIQGSPVLSQQIVNVTADTIELTNNLAIESRAASTKRLRGPTYCSIFCDEIAFLPSDNSVNPDSEILNAVRPGLATTGGPLFMISSPYAKKGVLYDTFKRHYGPAGDPLILVGKATSRELNPTLPQSVVDRAMERDPAAASAEWLARFRDDVSSLVPLEVIMRCVDKNVLERSPVAGTAYECAVDMSGGQSDSAALCIGHAEAASERIVVDCVREILSPHSPEQACAEFAAVMKSYGLVSAVSDKYASAWPVEQFSRMGIVLRPELAARTQLYQDLLATMNSARVRLLHHERLIAQIASLERRTGRSHDSIDAPNGQHEDVANAVAGLVAQIISKGSYDIRGLIDAEPGDELGVEGWRRMRNAAYLMSGGMMKLW